MKRAIPLMAALIAVHVLPAFPKSASAAKDTPSRLRLNRGAFDYARELIATGHLVNDKHGEWGNHQPSAGNETDFIRSHRFDEYSRWHLAIDESHLANSKARYKFPLGDFENVHRCALIAIQNRARQCKYRDIESAAKQLLELVERQAITTSSATGKSIR
jgi:hypothetical protein